MTYPYRNLKHILLETCSPFTSIYQSCQPALMACLGLSAGQVRRPGQAEILSFGLACFEPETTVLGQQARPSYLTRSVFS